MYCSCMPDCEFWDCGMTCWGWRAYVGGCMEADWYDGGPPEFWAYELA